MADLPVTLKGINGDVVLKINPNSPFEEIVEFIRTLVLTQRNFFSKGYLSIDTQGRELSQDEIKEIEEIFSGIGVSFRINESEKVYGKDNLKQNNVLIVDHTVRSGQLIRFDGDVIILGNINPGGEVEVSNNLYVFGSIKGTVKVGKRVVALGFQPTSLFVGGKIVDVKTDERAKKPRILEIVGDTISFKTLEERELKPTRRGRNG